GGKARHMSLGQFPAVSLEQARDRANELRRAARAGIDLKDEEERARLAAARRLTIHAIVDRYLAERAAGLRTGKELRNRVYRSLAPIFDRPAAEIHRRDIRPLLEEVNARGLTREAEKRRQIIGAMFRWALSRDLIERDPTDGIEAFDAGTPRSRVLSNSEI